MSVGGLKVAVPADAAARGVARVGIAEVGAERSQQVDACDGRRRCCGRVCKPRTYVGMSSHCNLTLMPNDAAEPLQGNVCCLGKVSTCSRIFYLDGV